VRGNKSDILEIHGMLGFSPKLLHIIYQLTHYAAGLYLVRIPPAIILTVANRFTTKKTVRRFRQ
jgi:hypothetical protein